MFRWIGRIMKDRRHLHPANPPAAVELREAREETEACRVDARAIIAEQQRQMHWLERALIPNKPSRFSGTEMGPSNDT